MGGIIFYCQVVSVLSDTENDHDHLPNRLPCITFGKPSATEGPKTMTLIIFSLFLKRKYIVTWCWLRVIHTHTHTQTHTLLTHTLLGLFFLQYFAHSTMISATIY
jgi:hypothetical protein